MDFTPPFVNRRKFALNLRSGVNRRFQNLREGRLPFGLRFQLRPNKAEKPEDSIFCVVKGSR